MNPYESPALNSDKARYDRTLFWRIAKCSLALLAIFVVLDFGIWVLRPSMMGFQGTDDAILFVAGHNGWLRDVIDRIMDFVR